MATREMAARAVKLVLIVVLAAMKTVLLKRKHLHIVILDPRMTRNNSKMPVTLYEFSMGRKQDWAHKYDVYARAKARATWREELSTREIVTQYPHLLRAGDTTYFGSVYRHGFVVACSGVEEWFDEWVAGMIADTCYALCQDSRALGVLREVDGFIVD